jgi:two-component system chemotaxis sensor kinase CheA
MNEAVHEFLIETHENLAQLDLDLVTLEKDPTERETLSRVFRTMHTVKGSAGFLGFEKLQAVAHAAENLLSRLRDGAIVLNAEIASALLMVVDAVRQMLEAVESIETDGDGDYSVVIQKLERLNSLSIAALPPIQPIPAPAPAAATTARVTAAAAPVTGTTVAAPKPSESAASRTMVAPAATIQPTIMASDSSLVEPAESRESAISQSSIRVGVSLLDKLMTLVGELVLARNQIVQFSAAQENPALIDTVQRLNLLTTELQAGVMKTRMQPIGAIWSKFPRVVRDLAVACGKQASLEMEGQETELDKSIIEAIRDPLTHLIRNAVDHGIEPPAEREARGKNAEGRVALHAFHEGGKVIIEIVDDGGGIDPQRVRAKAVNAKLITNEHADRMNDRELVNLVFLAGFSTADHVTQFSGRGVGMDVVRSNIEKIGGTVTIDSRLGHGTTVRMKIPLTLAIIPALTISCAGDRYAIPQVSLLELVRLEGEQAHRGLEMIHGAPVYRLRGNLLPIVYLDRELGVHAAPQATEAGTNTSADQGAIDIVVLQADDRQFGLVVDAIHDTEEIVVKPLQKQTKGISAFAGATIMGDGKVALILDVLGLAQKANVVTGVRERALSEKPTSVAESTAERQTVLLFATKEGGRMAIPLSLVARLEEFPRSSLEKVGPFDVVQYRDEILPLIHVSDVLRPRQFRAKTGRLRAQQRAAAARGVETSDPVQVVVYASDGKHVGLVVDRILDIAEEAVVSRSPARRPGILFTAVIQDRVTEFLDVEGIIRSADPELFDEPQTVAVEA